MAPVIRRDPRRLRRTGRGCRRALGPVPVRAARSGAAAGRPGRATARAAWPARHRPPASRGAAGHRSRLGGAAATQAGALRPAGFVPARRPVQVSTTGMFVPLHADEEAQWRQLNQNVRRNVDQCRKAGVEVVRFDAATPTGELVRGPRRVLRDAGRDRHAPGLRGRAATGRLPQPRAAAAHRGRATHRSGWPATRVGTWPTRWSITRATGRCCSRPARRTRAAPSPSRGAPAASRFAANFLLQWTIIRWAAEAGFSDLRHERRRQPRGARAADGRVASAVEPVPLQVAVGGAAGPVRGRLGVRALAAACGSGLRAAWGRARDRPPVGRRRPAAEPAGVSSRVAARVVLGRRHVDVLPELGPGRGWSGRGCTGPDCEAPRSTAPSRGKYHIPSS